MDWNETLSRYHVGQIVTAEIERVDHGGIHSRIDGGAVGYTKRSEAMLTRRVVNLHQHFSTGQSVKARIIGFNSKYCSVDISFRQAVENPWDEYSKRIKVGDFIEGQVVLLTESKALVEIIPGIVGILPRGEMWMSADTVDQILMVDDLVRLQVIKIDEQEKVLVLSARGLYAKEKDQANRRATFKIEEKLTSALQVYRWEQTRQVRRKYTLSGAFRKRFKKVCILLHDERVAKSLSGMLASFQVNASIVNLSDIKKNGLCTEKTLFIVGCHSGSEFLPSQLQKQAPHSPLLILGTVEDLRDHKVELQKSMLYNAQLKIPHAAEDLISALNNIAEEKQVEAPPDIAQENKTDDLDDYEMDRQIQTPDLETLLLDIKYLTGSSFVVIFQLNQNTMETEIYASTSRSKKLGEFDRGHLQFSPISDVIVDGDFIFEEGGGYNFKYMKPLGFFESLVGIRINITDEYGYGLFFFGEKARQFSSLDKGIFNFCELAVRAQIEHNKLLEKNINEQRFVLTGKLASNFMHEIKNQIQSMDYWLEILKTDSIHLNAGKIKGTDKTFLARFEQSINGALETEKRTRNVEELFLNLLRTGDKRDILLEKYLHDFVQTIMPVAARARIKVNFSAPRNLHVATNVSSLNQILINLFLNSIDFIPLVRKQTGEIMISAYRDKEDKLPIKIEFKDNGPGVNERKREKIFELLYTTKNKGSGLGLAISRRLAKEMGGKLSVKETRRLSGVTFLLELPQN